MLPCDLVQEVLLSVVQRMKVSHVELGLVCNVSFPLPHLCWFLEAAQRLVIPHRKCCVQELAVRQDH